MNRGSTRGKRSTGLRAKAWLIGSAIVLLPLSLVLIWNDNFTELTPRHDGIRAACVVFVIIAVVASAIFGWRLAASGRLKRGTSRMDTVFKFVFVSSVAMALLLVPAIEVIEGWIDFPASTARSFPAFIPISRAYEVHGRGVSWSLQFQPNWPRIPTSYNDYKYMQGHLPSDHNSDHRNEIASDGYFCARVSLQQAGKAVRIMHSGWGGLPDGSVVICPTNGKGDTIIPQ